MKKTFSFFIKHYLFFFVIFIFFRIIFLISLLPFSEEIPSSQVFTSLFAGFKTDLSTASYFAVLPFLLLAINLAGAYQAIEYILRKYYLLIISIVVLFSLANIIVFKNWGTLLNSRALAFVLQPKEMFASVTTWNLILILTIILLLIYGCYRFYKRFVLTAFQKINGTTLQRAIALIVLLPLLVIGIRGGIQLIPVNESHAAFSSHRVLNQVAINNIWYLGHNLKQAGINETNPYHFMNDDEAGKLVHQYVKIDKTGATQILNSNNKPNVVIILLESWTADIIEPLGGIKNVTPEFTKLCNDGLLFSSVYASGFRTDQALISVLGGFPAQPNRSIIRFPEKTSHLPSVSLELKKNGYATSFFYGGELGFANMNSYLLSSGFSKLTSEAEFDAEQRNSKWGAHDEFVLAKQLEWLQLEKEPFLSVLLTLSTHEPFEVPLKTPFNGSDEAEKFKNSAWYTDKCLGNYFENVKKMPWFNNTIFILLADHGHRLPLKRDYFDPETHKIPVLVYSPLLKSELRGTKNNALSSQHDIAATLLSCLNISSVSFEWSNNMLDTTRNNFAYLSLDNAVTWLEDSSVVILPLEPGLPGYGANLPAQKAPKAYLQHLYSTFLAY